MLAYLARIMEFLNDESKLVVFEKEFQIDGFKGLLVEPQKDFETTISIQTLRNLQKFLRSISDQPLTISFDYHAIYIQNVIV